MGANESGAPWPSLAPFTPTNATGAEGSTPLPFATEEEEVLYLLGPVRDPMSTVIPMTLVYALIFTTGLLGNVCTCIVIARNKYMHTTVNYYLFSLSVSDLLLLVLGLPQELWMLWKKYPYVFGDTFCILRAFTSETCTNASVLTITAFTIERYIAICHPLKAHTMANLPRAVKTILCIWAVAALCSIPIAFQLGVIHQVSQLTGADMASSGQCAVKRPVPRTFEVATGLFFVLPMTVISILYLLIGYQLRKSSRTMAASKSNGSNGGTASGCGDQYQPSSHHRDSLAVPIATGRSRSDSCVPQSSHFRSGSNKHHSSSRRAVIKMLGKCIYMYIYIFPKA
ncbi:Neuropeptides capa receptor [Halotydeus destructor]|nr:Neuropeptides capa receptor [Halotydeus destructor]